ncbi:TetR/AcrR family transcriptional regulator [Streptomyces odontomachi]|uniref:TetR/AcrR family transcriptional regulator n=1 Tax=Streptomyces odontomachi TaxID=2944940 RepID=UPI002109461F|nr:TetR/AcrR family transcriptional regulator [Streptomyces sp. ODS25]
MTLLWERQPVPRRGPKPALDLDAIARAGIAVADAEGLAALTMQRVAAALGVTKMALYRYVPGKEELVALMVETGIGEPPSLADGSEGWRPKLDTWARQMFERFRRHPWVSEATVGARPIGPCEFGWMEQAVVALSGTGLDGGEKLDVAATLAGHVRSLSQQEAAVGEGAESVEGAMTAGLGALVQDRMDRFPALKEAFASAVAHGSQDNALDFGLARILDGVELLVARRGRQA